MTQKKTKKTKSRSRIPGVYVGNEVDTRIGRKKKVCFNIGGRWIFRMVDSDWRAPGRPTKTRRKGKGAAAVDKVMAAKRGKEEEER